MMDSEPLRRVVDKFAERTMGSLTPLELDELFEASAARGAYRALAHVGLQDEESAENLKSVLSSMRGYKKASQIVRMSLWKQIKITFRILSWVVGIATTIFLLKAFFPAEDAERLIKFIPHG